MKEFTFGEHRITRRSIPSDLADLNNWPTVDVNSLNGEDCATFDNRAKAIQLFIESPVTSIADIHRLTGVSSSSLYRLFSRCIEQHDDGRIFGYRALLRYTRIKNYQRHAKVAPGKAGQNKGTAGALTHLLSQHPEIDRWLKQRASQHTKPTNGKREGRGNINHLHKKFLQKCRESGVSETEYPFNQAYRGKRSLSAHFKHLTESTYCDAATKAGAKNIAGQWIDDLEILKKPVTRPFEAVEFDGHKIDLRLTVEIVDPFGMAIQVEVSRIWLLLVLDVATRSVLGYSLAFGTEYNMDDVAEAIESALTPHVPKHLSIAGLSYSETGGFPSRIVTETAYVCWDWFRYDNAKTHLAVATIKRLTRIVGSWPCFGPKKSPNKRAFIETFFRYIGEHLSHRLPGTTGSSPEDIRRLLSDPNGDISLLIKDTELEELVDVILSDYNGMSHGGIGGRTPLEAMQYMMDHYSGIPRRLSLQRRKTLCILRESVVSTIRGNKANGVRPHINFKGVRYSNALVSSSPRLVGQKIRFYYHVKDLRNVHAFFLDGEELGILNAAKPWCFTPHSLRTRQEILRLTSTGKLNYREGEDPVEAYIKHKQKLASRKKTDANTVAQAQKDAVLAKAASSHSEESTTPPKTPEPKRKPTQPRDTPKVKKMKIRRTITF